MKITNLTYMISPTYISYQFTLNVFVKPEDQSELANSGLARKRLNLFEGNN